MEKRMVCENGHGFSDSPDFEICPYCGTKFTLKEYTQEDVDKTRVWFANKPKPKVKVEVAK